MVTIKDIARESGYSISTVSRVINNQKDVNEETKSRIMAVVDKYGFVPNSNARQLKQVVDSSITIIVKGTKNMIFGAMVEEIESLLSETKYSTTVCYVDEDADEVEYGVRICREQKPLGIFFLGGNPEHFNKNFKSVTVPSVIITTDLCRMPMKNLSSVSTDDVMASKAAVDYLISMGHQEIGVLGGNLGTSFTAQERLKGCQMSFREHGMAFDATTHYSVCRYAFDSAYRATERLLESAPDVTAIFAISDIMAIGCIRAIMDAGKRVPEDISVMGFDGTEYAKYYCPKLTTVAQDGPALVKRAVEIMLEALGRLMQDIQPSTYYETVPFNLIEGESVIRR